jgi:hypothetical protein
MHWWATGCVLFEGELNGVDTGTEGIGWNHTLAGVAETKETNPNRLVEEEQTQVC